MKTFAWIAVLLCTVSLLVGCSSEEPPAPVPSPDVPTVELPDEPSPVSPPAAPAFEDELDQPPMTPAEPPVGPELGDPVEPVPDEPVSDEPAGDESAATENDRPGVTRAFGAALLKGITEGATGNP